MFSVILRENRRSLFFPGGVAGTVSDTLQFPIREIRDNEIRQTIPSSALFLRQPSNIKDTIIYDPLTKRYVVASLIGGKYYYKPPFYGNLAGSAESPFENVVVRIQPEADSGRE